MDICPCGSALAYDECCGPLIRGERSAVSAEQVMRARYTAYVTKDIPYLLSSLHPEHRTDFDEKSTRKWAEGASWHKLEILETEGGGPGDDEGMVEFIASYTEERIRRDHHERATFKKEAGTWFFVSGEPVPPRQVVRDTPKTGRNDPCPCGSGRKYKKCCGA